MKARSALLMLLATPLGLLNLGFLPLAGFLLFSTFYLLVPAFPTLWPLTLGAAASAALYIASLVFIAADAVEGGVRALRPKRFLRCSLLGFAMNSAGALLGFVILFVMLAISGAVY